MSNFLKTTALRIPVFALIFAFVLPAAFGFFGSNAYAFHGSFLLALGTGAAYMVAMFATLFLFSVAIGPWQKQLRAWKHFDHLSAGVCFVASSAFVAVVSSVVPVLGIAITGFWPALLAGIVCLAGMSVTLYATSPCYRKAFGKNGHSCQGNCYKSQCSGSCSSGCGGNKGN